MNEDEFQRGAARATQWANAFFGGVRELPVLSKAKPGEIAASLPPAAPEAGESIDEILDDFERLIIPGLTHWNHPRFFAYYAITGSRPGAIADLLAATVNVNAMLWRASPAATELEQVTLGWLRQWLGLPPEFFGLIYDTATTSTFHALIAARQRIAPEARTEGNPPGLVMYTSAQANLSVERAAIAAGIGQANVRLIPLDAQYRMDPRALAQAIANDRSRGLQPFAIVAATGTTATAAIDPVSDIADIAARENLWLHIDGAYGGTYAILEEMRAAVAGWERADSLVVNPHKGLGTPIDMSAFYTRHPEILRQALALTPDYLSANPGEENLTDYGLPLGRRFRALKLWFVMRSYGRAGVEEILRRHLDYARQFADWVRADARFELAAPPAYTLICFRLRAGDDATRAALERVNASGLAFLSSTMLDGKFTIRLAIGNFETTLDDLRQTWQALQQTL